uniref:N-acetylglucosaminylphosphatidylinositol deacetylase n=1 Tax=Lygus hesperus TaxID=30085 RepID=A0A0A9XT99_LYGHE
MVLFYASVGASLLLHALHATLLLPHLLFMFLFTVFVLHVLWYLYTTGFSVDIDNPGNRDRANRRDVVLLVTAHPDDECIFFTPAILAFLRTHTVHLVCFSDGDAEGLGHIRIKELSGATSVLNLQPQHVTCIRDPRL